MIAGRFLLAVSLAAAAAGCATAESEPRDPWEGMNRRIYRFNDSFDDWIARPVATKYRDLLHGEIRGRVRNFFSNLADPFIGVNNMLQGKLEDGFTDWVRFVFNTTFGLLGIHDVASDMGLEKHNEDFGQTLGRWGVGSGAYVVLPLLGPSSVRDGFSSLFVDWHFDPLWYIGNVATRNSVITFRFIERRASLLDVSNLAEEAALDHYAYIRDAFLQRRRSQVFDGDPPPEPDPEKSSDSGERQDTAARAQTGLPQAQILTERGERVITAADEELTPAREFSSAPAQPVAARPEEDVITAGYEPGVPVNSGSLPAVSGEARTGLTRTKLRQ